MLSALSFIVLHSPIVGVLFCLFGLSKRLLYPFAQRKRQFCLSPQAFCLHSPQNIVPLQGVVAAARLSDCQPVGGGVHAVLQRKL